MEYIWLVVGFVLLVKGADFFVDGASSIAGKLKVPSLIIGLTVVSMGTSMPEAAVSISASISGNNAISLGNAIGSNLFNLLMVVGISSVILPIATDRDILKRDMPINVAITAVLFAMLLDGTLGRLDSVLLLVLFAGYMALLLRSALLLRFAMEDLGVSEKCVESPVEKELSWTKSLVLSVAGLVAIVGGGQMVVNNAKIIAATLGMGETLIGLTVVAFGTSLPELVTSIVAARKGESGIAMGNVVGSNIFNILFVLGLAGVISPMTADAAFFIDTGILIAVSVMMMVFAFTKRETNRTEGAVSVLTYIFYTAYIIMRAYHIWIF